MGRMYSSVVGQNRLYSTADTISGFHVTSVLASLIIVFVTMRLRKIAGCGPPRFRPNGLPVSRGAAHGLKSGGTQSSKIALSVALIRSFGNISLYALPAFCHASLYFPRNMSTPW